ncbi:MAG: glycoside hydrolase family 31 protein [Clostridia bacterium]|nr:glycoside hydrolase family 31 protein [Clostridia bacterium]
MARTLQFTHIAPGILRIRLSELHAETLAERYGIITLPQTLSDSGITYSDDTVTLPDGRLLPFRIVTDETEEYQALHDSLVEEFKEKYTDYQAIIGTPEEAQKPSPIPVETLPPEAAYAIYFGIGEGERFYGLGEGANDRIQLRGRAYQNWVRYQYNEIPIPLVISSSGWGIFLNARSRSFMDIGGRVSDQLICLGEDDELDLFILWGGSYQGVLKAYTTLTGNPMVMPKWAYGLTYIAPIFSDQMEVLADAERFRKESIPVDMISLEPGWMEKFYDYSTAPQWDTKRFHICDYHMTSPNNPITFVSALHRMNLKLSLWRCIRYDLTAEAERELADGSVEDYGEGWYEHLKKFTYIGVDGYKLDPADMVCCFDRMNRPRLFNGLTSMQMHNYNQILLTKQVKEGFEAQTNKRSMHHYSGGYTGIQHWSASTTGDNGGELGAMIWLETLALSGHMNTTIDMNIHHPESIHFGMFVPWAHLNAWHGVEQPWYAGDDMHKMFVEYARIRYRILPYYYSAALEGHEEAMPIVRPMPLAFPEDEATMDASRQYMIGDSLLVSAYADSVHLPAGRWIDGWTGEEYAGPCDINPYNPPEGRGGGLFIKGGAIIPGWRDRKYMAEYDDSTLTLDIWPDGDSSYILREDDGVSLDYQTNTSCHTEITVHEGEESVDINIGERVGDYNGKPESRTWLVRVHPKENDDRFLNVRCAAGDKVFFSIPKNPVALFACDGSDALKV